MLEWWGFASLFYNFTPKFVAQVPEYPRVTQLVQRDASKTLSLGCTARRGPFAANADHSVRRRCRARCRNSAASSWRRRASPPLPPRPRRRGPRPRRSTSSSARSTASTAGHRPTPSHPPPTPREPSLARSPPRSERRRNWRGGGGEPRRAASVRRAGGPTGQAAAGAHRGRDPAARAGLGPAAAGGRRVRVLAARGKEAAANPPAGGSGARPAGHPMGGRRGQAQSVRSMPLPAQNGGPGRSGGGGAGPGLVERLACRRAAASASLRRGRGLGPGPRLPV
jgi:hypothetical protein